MCVLKKSEDLWWLYDFIMRFREAYGLRRDLLLDFVSPL